MKANVSRRAIAVVVAGIVLAKVAVFFAGLLGVEAERDPARADRRATIFPQHGTPPNLRGYNAIILLQNPPVCRDIGFTAAQQQQLAVLSAEFLREVKAIVEMGKGLHERSKQEQNALWLKINSAQKRAVKSADGRALELLTEGQQSRLAEIAFQLRVEEVFYERDVALALRLTPGQSRDIAAARRKLRQTAQDLARKLSAKEISKAKHLAEVANLRQAQLRRYVDLLDAQQLESYRALRGTHLTFTKDDLAWEIRRGRLTYE